MWPARPTPACDAQRRVDAAAQAGGVPRAGEEVEVERGVQLGRAEVEGQPLGVGHPHLADEQPGLVVAVGDPAPRGVDVVQLVAVDVRVLPGAYALVGGAPELGAASGPTSGRAGSLATSTAESMRTPAAPRSNQKRRMSSCSRRTSGCVQFRSGCSGVKRWRYHSPGVPSVVLGAGPGNAAELGHPVVGRLVAAGAAAGPEPEARPLGRPGPGGERGLEPRVLVGHVVGDDVDDRADAHAPRPRR